MSTNTFSNPLYLLAQVASEVRPASRPPSPYSESRKSSCSATTFSSETPYTVSPPPRSLRPLARSKHNETNFVPYVVRTKKKSHKSESDIKARLQMKRRRKELMDKANKIKSLENSPVNERQLAVLRMIFDEITMYPCESWMVLVAIVIHRWASPQRHCPLYRVIPCIRAYKQVKNWFSNERQKNRCGDSVSAKTEEGDSVRLRSSALSMRPEWSESFFEELLMIYNYKVQRNSQSNHPIRRSSRTSDQWLINLEQMDMQWTSVVIHNLTTS